MGLLDRVGRIVRANLNDWVRTAEDPEKLVDAAIADLHQDLVHLRQAVAQAVAMHKRTERQWMQAQAAADEWYRRAQLALDSGNEALAREALERRQPYQQSSDQMAAQLRDRTATMTQLRDTMRQVEQKLLEVRTQRDFYLARARSAEATQRLQQITGQLNQGTDPLLSRLADKVTYLEAQAHLGQPPIDPVVDRLAQLEQQQRLEDDLQQLRQSQIARSQRTG